MGLAIGAAVCAAVTDLAAGPRQRVQLASAVVAGATLVAALGLGEYAGVLLDLHAMGEQLAPGYWAIQAALATFADRGFEARVVFWFDN